MTLTNYWWLLIWLVAIGGALTALAPRKALRVGDETAAVWSPMAVFLLVLPYVIWAANRTWFGDTEVYRKGFLTAPTTWTGLRESLANSNKDAGFTLLVFFLRTLLGGRDKLYFTLIAGFQMYCVARFFRRYSTNFLLCFFMFVVSTDYLSWMFNGMRQFIAVGLILLSFGLVLKERLLPAILVILLASTIHGSALMMLPLTFVIRGKAWNWKTLALIVGVGVAILFIDQFTPLLDHLLADTQYNDILTNEIWQSDDGTSIFRALFYSIPAALALVGKPFLDRENSKLANLTANCAVCTAVLYFLSVFSSGIYVGRLPIYTTLQGYAAVPWLLDHTFTKSSARIVRIVLVIVYLCFFYYQMHMAWGLL